MSDQQGICDRGILYVGFLFVRLAGSAACAAGRRRVILSPELLKDRFMRIDVFIDGLITQ
jgi:hypothetical protein